MSALSPLHDHTAFRQVFQPGRLTFGFITPLEAYPDSPFPTLKDHERLVRRVDEAGFASLWLRDVPFYDPTFGDAGQVLDPFVYAGMLASVTRLITLGTTGIVLPLRDPVFVAKQAASVDQLSGGRFVLGLSTGDRPTEYPTLGADFDNRDERFREAFGLIRTLHQNRFPALKTRHYGDFRGNLDLVPKPSVPRLPMMCVGRARQPIEWIAQHTDAWIWSVSDPEHVAQLLATLREAAGDNAPPPYGYATFFDLAKDPDAPEKRFHNVIRIGRKALIEKWHKQRETGVTHIALNMKPSHRPVEEVLDELAEHVLPVFNGND